MPSSKLQRRIKSILLSYFGEYRVEENIRPEWLISDNGTRLELDFYIPGLKAAIEVQGEQHYIFTPHFHNTYSDFLRRLDYDRQKKKLCIDNGIIFIEVTNEFEARVAFDKLISDINLEDEKLQMPATFNQSLIEVISELLHIQHKSKVLKKQLRKIEKGKRRQRLAEQKYFYRLKKKELIGILSEMMGREINYSELVILLRQARKSSIFRRK